MIHSQLYPTIPIVYVHELYIIGAAIGLQVILGMWTRKSVSAEVSQDQISAYCHNHLIPVKHVIDNQ